MAEKTRRIEEAAKAAEEDVRENAGARLAAVNTAGHDAIATLEEKVHEEQEKAARAAVAADQWYEQQELPFLRGLAAEESRRDLAMRKEAQSEAQFRLMQLRRLAKKVQLDH